MLIALLIFEVILMLIIILTTCMVENKFKYIIKSLQMYKNIKAYTTEETIAFIDGIINRYNECLKEPDSSPDIDSIVKNHLSKEYIGKFPYTSVKNIATRLKEVMRGIVIIEILIAILNHQGATLEVVTIVSISTILTVVMEFYSIIRGLDEKSDNLITEVSDYVVNTYKLQESKKLKDITAVKIINNKVIALDQRGNKVDARLTSQQEAQLQAYKEEIMSMKKIKDEEVVLNAQDIAELLGILS